MFSQECFEVFQKYEKHVHGKDKDSKSGYENFLCQSPLYDPRLSEEHNLPHFDKKNIDDHRERKDEGVFPQALGCYHMIHRIDGKVAIVGVVDFTGECLSSVYLYYDPQFEFLNPGTLSAIREIEYIKKVRESGLAPDTFSWYYMGLYYQDCQKSVYKATYKPSQLLCPITSNFVTLTEELKQKIASEKMPRLAPEDAQPGYPVPAKRVSKEKGMRSVIKMDNGNELSFFSINKAGQKLLEFTLPELFEHLGEDVMNNLEVILC